MGNINEKKIIYVTGKTKGILGDNKEKFINACRFYKNKGYEVINPHEIKDVFYPDNSKELKVKQILGIELYFLSKADIIAVIDGWQDSSIVIYEIALAIKLDMPVIKAFSFEKLCLDCKLRIEEIKTRHFSDSINEETDFNKCRITIKSKNK